MLRVFGAGGAVDHCTAAGRSQLSLLERGVRSPTLRTLFRLAGHLSTPPSDMVLRVPVHATGTDTPAIA